MLKESSIGILIIIVIIFTMTLTKKQKNNNELRLNRHLLPNRNIQDKVYLFMSDVIKRYFSGADSLDFTNIKIKEMNGYEYVIAEFYMINKKENSGWNVTQNKVQIYGKADSKNGKFELLDINDESNCIDVGTIIPEISDRMFNPFSRNRYTEDHIKNWSKYKKEWDVTWSDIPINRDKIYSYIYN